MALSQFLRGFWDDPWEGMQQPSRIYDQYFGSPLSDEVLMPRALLNRPSMISMIPRRLPQQTGKSEVVNTDKEFKVSIDVQHFNPEEIDIKTKDNRVVIHARHEERPDEHGFIMREFTRQYCLPKDVDPSAVTSVLSKDGVLTLKAPKLALEEPKERAIPITHESGDN